MLGRHARRRPGAGGAVMGMFDYLRCEYPLPVEGRLPEGEANKLQFQTKDLNCALDEYTITQDGELVGQNYDIEDRSGPTKEGLAALAGCMTRVNIRPRPLPDYTGEVRFYTDYGPRNKNGWGGGWIEFSSYFRKGKMISISLIEFREPQPKRKKRSTSTAARKEDGRGEAASA